LNEVFFVRWPLSVSRIPCGSDVDAARELGIFLDEESVINLEDDGEINILSAVATYSAQSKQKPRVL